MQYIVRHLVQHNPARDVAGHLQVPLILELVEMHHVMHFVIHYAMHHVMHFVMHYAMHHVMHFVKHYVVHYVITV